MLLASILTTDAAVAFCTFKLVPTLFALIVVLAVAVAVVVIEEMGKTESLFVGLDLATTAAVAASAWPAVGAILCPNPYPAGAGPGGTKSLPAILVAAAAE